MGAEAAEPVSLDDDRGNDRTRASGGAPVGADDRGVTELYGLLAYGEISAFYRLSEDAARMAPSVEGRVALARMAAAEMSHFDILEKALADRRVDIVEAMRPFRRAIDDYHVATAPSTWLEALVKAHVGDGIAADFYRHIAGALPGDVGDVVRAVLADTGNSEFVLCEVRDVLAKDSREHDALVLFGRRMLGEAITQAQYVLAQREELAELVLTAIGDLSAMATLFDRMQVDHAQRMAALGLS